MEKERDEQNYKYTSGMACEAGLSNKVFIEKRQLFKDKFLGVLQ